VIGILVEYFGKSMAEGFLHDFEGWAVFMLCTGLLLAEIVVLNRIGGRSSSLAEVFALEPVSAPDKGTAHERKLSLQFIVAAVLVAIAATAAHLAPAPAHEVPERKMFAEFPSSLKHWRGAPQRLEPEYLSLLKLDDYILAEYSDGKSLPVNLYVSYYASQANGNSAHSPRACIPGDGWEISAFTERELGLVDDKGLRLRVNRVVISKGENRQLVYYWFQQRGRTETNEYMVKLNIFRDAVTRHRSDGAMVRLVARLRPGEPESVADALLEDFARVLLPELAPFIPE
jgi:exosortase D (VPLPA-CTERM-specific)